LKRDWHESFTLAEHYCQLTGDEHLALNTQFVSYWLHPDSSRMLVDLPILAEKFNKLEHYINEADAYKCLGMFYSNKGEYEAALVYANKSIDAYNTEECPSKVLLASVLYFKGQVLMALGDRQAAYLEFNRALAVNNSGGYKGGNYQIYLTMYRYEYGVENYKDACFFLRTANKSFEALSNDKLVHYYKMTTIFSKIKLIEEELKDIKAQAIRRIVFTSMLLFILFTLVVIWMRSKKRYFEKRSVDMEGKNMKLKVETGELLLRSNQNKLTSKIINSQYVVERKMAKILISE
jgi:tetratricopeptide (TPR) repeat protein